MQHLMPRYAAIHGCAAKGVHWIRSWCTPARIGNGGIMQLKNHEQPWYWFPHRIHAAPHYHQNDWYLWLWFKWWAR